MIARTLIAAVLLAASGCATTQAPRWEVTVSIQVESQLDEHTKAKGGVELKRPLAAPSPKPKS